ncbi:helix-turn-helix domain-containing protein [Roseovarius sp. LXJ103]|uniref:AraC-like ligand-binding domain-containing protein n=1 Tax=Roseovarius carneus TaxID=2853164 RepID=UPI000D607984|nr:helix-turn-helix domain-containing protein [Roseovarius carneus]MBZ8119273.1 helix-turn-helix domain-containing protein [Roseovarius carneus]PWE35104.1 AraC family transcriptional regulator [Pelagicola sp. LXJ1103]
MYFSTAEFTAPDKSDVWARKLSETYFSLEAECHNAAEFQGELKSWSLGVMGLSEMECDGVLYHRRREHFAKEQDASLLITIPHKGDVHFKQAARDTKCGPGAFLVERGDMPYEFWHAKRNRLWVLKVPTASVRSRLGATDRLGSLTFDATGGVGSYFVGAVRNTIECIDMIADAGRDMAGQHLLDLLCLSMRSDDRILDSNSSTIRAAHLQRAEQYIRDNLANPNLSSQLVAESCGISLRYLQRLFAETDNSIVGYIRDKRLTRCDEALRMVGETSTVANIAYKWGFYDQAQFCKHYRKRFGCTPTDTRRQIRLEAAREG